MNVSSLAMRQQALEGTIMTSKPAKKIDFSGLLESPDHISEKDVRYFRREVFGDGVVSPQEADALFAMNMAVQDKCDDWNEFFVEALTDHVVHQAEPRGYVSVANAEWMIDRISHDGHVEAPNELELLVKTLSKSTSSPEKLVGFTLKEIQHAVVSGEGPLARGRQLTKGVIGEAEVELIREVLYAFGSDRGIAISKTEAEALFELNKATIEAENHPAWRELFVKAIGNYLMAASTMRVPSRAEALAREAWLEDTDVDVKSSLRGAFSGFGKLFSKSFYDGVFDDAHDQMEKAWAARNERMAHMVKDAEAVTDEEADWLIDRLHDDGIICENEKALLDFIRKESPHVSEQLKKTGTS